jgi:sporulation protein YlmC with PRC-barrel domain
MRASHVTTLLASAALATPVLFSGAAPAQQRSDQQAGNMQANTGAWLKQEKPGQLRASKLEGLDVYNNNNEKIGDVSELLIDQSGRIEAVVVGVGGFLGMGEHHVAVPFNQLRWANESGGARRDRQTTGAGRDADQRPGSPPDHAILNMTKEQLKAAPEFRFTR